ncbi:uncharacterized protein BXZ73DRAFT_47735 [Epithele typhae]|uniref:uncharacterized protein n=1 Tax=Epithele typhae TaxID=378194 RepID=UPI0020077C97|nr:uncharacterized protein BXZ73DRAFT_47735 [Epithele typhae]KAH9930440.1 hypothetical protein BXZ73DRAFT_47735 [Epithele typhae]
MDPAFERIPAEIWLDIFELFPTAIDLYGISVTCRKFRHLTIRALHRDVVWHKAKHAALELKVWGDLPGMEPYVRSLVLGVTRLPAGHRARLVELDGTSIAGGVLHDSGDPSAGGPISDRPANIVDSSFAAPSLHDALWAKIQTFTKISSLTFANMYVLPEHFELVHSLPLLRALRIDTCAICSRSPHPALNHATLPITDLTLYNIRRATRSLPNVPGGVDDLAYALSLAVAQNLRRLSIDSTADVFRSVFGVWDAPARGWAIPPNLEHLYVKKGVVAVVERPSLFVVEHAFPDTHLYHFCVQAKSLRTVSTPIFVPAQVPIAPEALPAGLERLCAPLDTVQLVAGVRPLQAIGLLKCGVAAREGIMAMSSIGYSCPRLKMLLVELKGWDEEILSAAAQLFKCLRRLKVLYDGAGPSEDFLVSLAPEFLVNFPDLHTLQLYHQPPIGTKRPDYPTSLYDESFDTIEEELRNIIIPWNRYCPNLRLVQLHAGYVMTRAFEGATWNLERVRRVEEIEELDY